MKKSKYDILVVEDEPVVLSAIRKIIEAENLRMDEALNGDIALSKLSRESYRLVVTDLMLPRISGLDLITVIKKDHPCVPMIVITGYATLEKALQTFLLGSFDFIPKPFDTETFLAVIYRGLNYSRFIQQRGPEAHAYIPVTAADNLSDSEEIVYCLGCHSQIKPLEDGTVLVRAGGTFSNMIDSLKNLEIVISNDEILQGKCCAQFLTQDGLINRFWAPISGRIKAYNEDLEKNVHLINSDPYDKGWIFKVTPTNFREELKHLKRCKKGSFSSV